MNCVHTHFIGKRVKVHIARLHNGTAHVHDAAFFILRAAEAVPAEHEKPGVVDERGGRASPCGQGAQRHKRLVRGAWRVGAAQRAVEQWLVRGLVEGLPVFLVNTLDKQVRIKGGLGDERQYLPVAGVYGHHCAPTLSVDVFHQLLQFDVDRQHHRVSGCGGGAGELAHRTPSSGRLDLLYTGNAVQLGLIALLNAQLADVFGAPVIAGVLGLFYFFLLCAVDAADVANNVAGKLAMRIVAKQACLDFDAGESEALCGEARHFRVVQSGADGYGLKALGFFHEFFEAPFVPGADVQHARQLFDRAFHADHGFGRCYFQRIGRVVGRQNDAVAIGNEATVRNDGNDGRAVALGLCFQVIVAPNLQVQQTQQQQGKAHKDQPADDQHPFAKT